MVEYVTDLVQSRTQHGETCHRRSSQRPVMTGGRERIQMVMTRWATRAGDGDGEIQLVVLVHSLRFAVPSPGVAPSYDGSLGQGSKQRENHNDDTGGLKRKAHDLDVANTRAPHRTQRAHTMTKHKFGPCHVYLQTLKRGTASAHYAVRGGLNNTFRAHGVAGAACAGRSHVTPRGSARLASALQAVYRMRRGAA